jgi:hypothetical protein
VSERGGIALPGAPSATPGLPASLQPLFWHTFNGINTRPGRIACPDQQLFWADGWMPIAPDNLRILPDVGSTIYTASGSTVVWIGLYNIGDLEFCAALLSNGSLQQILTTPPHTVTQILPSGTIQNAGAATPSATVSGNTILGFAQFGSQYLLISKDTPNGYWIWDGGQPVGGAGLYTAGTLSPVVTLTAPGLGYTSPPTITVYTTGSGTGAAFTAALAPGTNYVEQVTVADPGSGYGEDDYTVAIVSGGGIPDAQALGSLVASPTTGGVQTCVVVNPGSAYTYAAYPVFSGGGGSGATGVCVIENGAITGITITNPGSGYSSAPVLTVTDNGYGSGSSHVDGGTGFSGQCNVAFGELTGITILNAGANYITPPTITFIGDGSGASAVANIDSNGTLNGDVPYIWQNQGSGYTKGFAVFSGGNNAANITITQMPYGISGTAIEIYQSRVWIANGAAAGDQYSSPPLPPKSRVIFSVSGDPSNYDPTQGAGAFQGNNSFLRVGYHALKQVNGFLYLLGDSSLDYISGVTTSTSPIPGTNPPVQGPPTTTFNLQNADPAIGSPWPSSALIINRKLTFGNPVGVYEAPGGAARKISLPLDGFYNTLGQLNGLTSNYPAAAATIYGLPVYMLLIPFRDLYTGDDVTKLVLWSGENWFTSPQSKSLTYIASQEINSVLTAWGTDGSTIFPLFQTPSTNFTKVVQSKLYGTPVYLSTKNTSSISAILVSNIEDGETADLYVDSETTEMPEGVNEPPNSPIQIVPGEEIIDQNGNVYGGVISSGPVYGPITVGQQGRLIGFTVVTNASDLSLLSVGLAERVESPNV